MNEKTKQIVREATIDKLCMDYTSAMQFLNHHEAQKRRISAALDKELIGLQSRFKRALATAGVTILRARVFALVNHAERPVTVLPVASAAVLVRKGVEVNLDFVATIENIEIETAKLKRAAEALK